MDRLKEIAVALNEYVVALEVAERYKDNGLSDEDPLDTANHIAVKYSPHKRALNDIIKNKVNDRDLLMKCFDVICNENQKAKENLIQELVERLDLL